MDEIQLAILSTSLLNAYGEQISKTVSEIFEKLTDSELSAGSFSFYTSVSAVFSSKIEVEDVELDSFIKHKMLNVKFLPDHTQKTDDLYEAYQYARKSPLNVSSLKHAHILLSSHILQKSQRGNIRTGNMFVTTPNGKIEYVACSPGKVGAEMERLYADIALLLNIDLILKKRSFLHR